MLRHFGKCIFSLFINQSQGVLAQLRIKTGSRFKLLRWFEVIASHQAQSSVSRLLDVLFPSDTSQLILRTPEEFPGQVRDRISPTGSSLLQGFCPVECAQEASLASLTGSFWHKGAAQTPSFGGNLFQPIFFYCFYKLLSILYLFCCFNLQRFLSYRKACIGFAGIILYHALSESISLTLEFLFSVLF